MFKRILIAVDRSDPAENAVHSGIDLATKVGAQAVALLTVLPPPPAIIPNLEATTSELDRRWDDAKRLLAHFRKQLPEQMHVEQVISEGTAADEIVLAATTWHADLVVLGTHNRHGLSRLLLGSTAEAVARRAPCTVLVVRPAQECKSVVDESAVAQELVRCAMASA